MHKTIRVILATLSVVMALLALFAWVVGRGEWVSLGTGGVPTAPSTAILLVFLSLILLAEIFESGTAVLRWFCRVTTVFITVSGFIVLLRPFFGWASPLEQWLAETTQTVGNVPIGQMSPLTGLTFLLAGSAIAVKKSRFLDKKWPHPIALALNGFVFWISAAVILSYVAGTPLFSHSSIIPMALWTAIIFFALSLAMALGYGSAESPVVSMISQSKKLLAPKPLGILISSLVVFVIITGGVVYLRGEEIRIQYEKAEELAAIGQLKIDQITRWRKERIDDILRLSEAPFLSKALEAWLHKPDDAALKKDILRRLKLETESDIYSQALLMDADGHILLSFPEAAEVSDEIQPIVKKVWNQSGLFISELHSKVPGEVNVDIMTAVHNESGQPLAVAVLTNDAKEYLFPMLRTWPIPHQSGETFLVRRDGDDALYLSDLKHGRNTALRLRLPLTKIKMPAVQAILGKTGPTIGLDNRGVEVFADLRPVPGTSWYLVTKVDAAEILAEVRFRAAITFAIISILIVSLLGMITLLYQIRLMKEREAATEGFKLSELKLNLALKSARMGVWQFDLVKNKRIFDHQVCALLGLDPATFGGTAEEFFAVVHPEDRGKLREASARTIKDGVHYEPEYRVVWSDGSIHHVASGGELTFNDQGKPEMINGLIWDITERKQLEREWVLTEARLVEAQAVAKIGSWETDLSNMKVAWSKQIYRIFEIDPDSFQSSHAAFLSFVHPEDRVKVDAAFVKSLEKTTPNEIGHRIVTPGGLVKFVEERWQIFHDDQKRPRRATGTCQDITERKKAEERLRESEVLYRELFENSWDALMILEPPSWRFASGNSSMVRMFGAKDKTELYLYSPWTLSPDRQPDGRISEEKAKAMIEIAMREGNHLFEWVHKRFNGDVFYAAVLLTRTEKQGKISLQASVRDITERKKAEEEIKKLNLELEERVRLRTAELAIAVKDLEAFGYSVAHDLKAPLRAMAGFANILSEDYAPQLDENGRRVIGVISDNARTMGQMIDDLLKLSHLGKVAMDFVDIDTTELVRSLEQELREGLSRDRAVNVEVKSLPSVRADLLLVRQIFTNLILNAIKFTAQKEKAVIKIGGYDQDQECVYYVKDNGAGFDMKYKEKLFGIFQRLHTQNEFKGTGIGLAVVKSAVLRHGGRVWAEGEVGQGATFYFTLLKGG